jgi:uncharacterized membrane protein
MSRHSKRNLNSKDHPPNNFFTSTAFVTYGFFYSGVGVFVLGYFLGGGYVQPMSWISLVSLAIAFGFVSASFAFIYIRREPRIKGRRTVKGTAAAIVGLGGMILCGLLALTLLILWLRGYFG